MCRDVECLREYGCISFVVVIHGSHRVLVVSVQLKLSFHFHQPHVYRDLWNYNEML